MSKLPRHAADHDLSWPVRGPANDFSPEEKDAIQRCLRLNLGPEFISYRPSPGGGKVAYLEGCRAIELANETFGFSGWSSWIKDLSVDFLDQTKEGKFNCGVSAVVRIELKNGTFHDDVGYGTGDNQKTKAAGLEKAKKEAITDAIKRALRVFGNSLGNCLYDKEYLAHVKKMQTGKREYPEDSVLRERDLAKRRAIEASPGSSTPVAVKRLHETYSELTVPRQKAIAELPVPMKQEPTGSPTDQQEVPPDTKLEPEEEDFGADLDLLLEADGNDAGDQDTSALEMHSQLSAEQGVPAPAPSAQCAVSAAQPKPLLSASPVAARNGGGAGGSLTALSSSQANQGVKLQGFTFSKGTGTSPAARPFPAVNGRLPMKPAGSPNPSSAGSQGVVPNLSPSLN